MQPTPPPHPAAGRSRRRALSAALALALAGACRPGLVAAQAGRSFPPGARLARLELRVFPEALLNGEPVRLGAGARIFDQRNMIVMPATLQGSFVALVERDASGFVGRVWLLTDEELKAAQARESGRGGAAQGSVGAQDSGR